MDPRFLSRLKEIFVSFLFGTCLLATSGLVRADLSSGLVAWYPFNGNANDESGNGHHGSVQGPRLTTDRFGNPDSAYLFNRENWEHIVVPHSNDLQPGATDEFTVNAWFWTDTYFGDSNSLDPSIISKIEVGFGNAWDLRIDTDGADVSHVVQVAVSDASGAYGSGKGGVQGDVSVNDGRWHMLTMTFDTSLVLRGYLDGRLFGETALPASWLGITNTKPMYIGNFERPGSSQNRHFTGAIDDISIYKRALTSEEIGELCGEFCGGPSPVSAGDFWIYAVEDIPAELARLPDLEQQAFLDGVTHALLGLFPPNWFSVASLLQAGAFLQGAVWGEYPLYELTCVSSGDFKTTVPILTVFTPRYHETYSLNIHLITEEIMAPFGTKADMVELEPDKVYAFVLKPFSLLEGNVIIDGNEEGYGMYKSTDARVGFEVDEVFPFGLFPSASGRACGYRYGDDLGDNVYEASFINPLVVEGKFKEKIKGRLNHDEDVDVIEIELREKSDIDIGLEQIGWGGANSFYLTVIDGENGNELYGNDRAWSSVSAKLEGMEPGKYYVAVESLDKWLRSRYKLSISNK